MKNKNAQPSAIWRPIFNVGTAPFCACSFRSCYLAPKSLAYDFFRIPCEPLKHPPMDVDLYLDNLLRQELTQTVKNLAGYRSVL
jgi:hypothetical protein